MKKIITLLTLVISSGQAQTTKEATSIPANIKQISQTTRVGIRGYVGMISTFDYPFKGMNALCFPFNWEKAHESPNGLYVVIYTNNNVSITDDLRNITSYRADVNFLSKLNKTDQAWLKTNCPRSLMVER